MFHIHTFLICSLLFTFFSPANARAERWRTRQSGPGARTASTAVWTGNEMIVWGGGREGGFLGDGGRYNPASDAWQPVNSDGAPSARWFHAVVWTGTEMIVWGGRASSSLTNSSNDGARYNPATDKWSPMKSLPAGRSQFAAVWTGTEMIVWGGVADGGEALSDGARYNPATDTWRPLSSLNAPSRRLEPSAVWTGTEMIVWGGFEIGAELVSFDTGGRYDPATDTWIALPLNGAPPPVTGHTAVWTGNEMIVWGGCILPAGLLSNAGGKYSPSLDRWEATSPNAPSPRLYHAAVWTGREMIIWGGQGNGYLDTGARYRPETDSWQPLAQLDAPAPRMFRRPDLGVWTGLEMIVYGGMNSGGELNSTFTYDPDAPAPPPPPPTVHSQPESQDVLISGNAVFNVVASGGEPLTYTWLFNGAPVSGAINPNLFLSSVDPANAGTYAVVVTNFGGSITSAPAMLTVHARWAAVVFENRFGLEVDAPVFNSDGLTRLSGSTFLAQLYGGPNASSLVPLGAVVPFKSDGEAGYVDAGTSSTREVPGVFPGRSAFLQIKAWAANGGASYEQAAFAGAQVGASPVFQLSTDPQNTPRPLTGLQSFSLSAPLGPRPPQILTEPSNRSVSPGQTATFSVVASAGGTLGYQWEHNGLPIPGATNATLTVVNAQPSNSGTYRVVVSNSAGSTPSASAVLTIGGTRWGTVNFNNFVSVVPLDAPIFDVDGVTRLRGTGFRAQLYGGPTADSLQALHPAREFRTGGFTGYIATTGGSVREVIGVLPGDLAFVQVKAWRIQDGASFEQAALGGGAVGASEVIQVITGGVEDPATGIPSFPANLVGLQSFSLSTSGIRPPLILIESSNLSVLPGQTTSFSVVVSGQGPLSYQWEHDGSPISGATNATLTVVNAQPADSGSYRVVVSNNAGSTSASVWLKVGGNSWGTVNFNTLNGTQGIRAPVFDLDGTTPLSGSNFLAQLYGGPNISSLLPLGAAVHFTTDPFAGFVFASQREVLGVPPGGLAFVQMKAWATRDGLSFEQTASSGAPVGVSRIIQVITGGLADPTTGIPSPPANLTGWPSFSLTYLVPRILTQPTNQFPFVGQSISMSVDVIGFETLYYQWFFNEAPLTGANSGSFSLTNIQLTDSGTYSIIVANYFGSVTSAPALLLVRPFPFQIIAQPADQSVFLGESALFTVTALPLEALQYQWLFNGTTLSEETNATLALLNVQTNQAGNYSVRVADAEASVLSSAATLRVSLPQLPAISSQSASLSVPLGQSARLFVATGSEPLTYQWRFNGANIPGATEYNLMLSDLQLTNSATYSVVISNKFGSLTSAPMTVLVWENRWGTVVFNNLFSVFGVDAPVFDEDGATKVSGDGFLAQLYGGASAGTLVPLGAAVHFRTGAFAGYVNVGSLGIRELIGVLPGETGFVQMKVWATEGGPSYEQAQAAGARTGTSPVVQVTTGGDGIPPTLPSALAGLQSFLVSPPPNAPPPDAMTAALVYPFLDAAGQWQLAIEGKPGAAYTVESSIDLVHWHSLTNLVSSGGPVLFCSPNSAGLSRCFYRVLLKDQSVGRKPFGTRPGRRPFRTRP